MDSGYKLKWLNGLLAGRELALPAGEVSLGGSDADVAVTLEDGRQAVLVVDDRGVNLNSEVPTWVDGHRWESDERLPLNVTIDIAGQAFVLGAASDTLANLPVPARCGGASPQGKEGLQGHQKRRGWPPWQKPIAPRTLGVCIVAITALGGAVAVLLLSKPAREAAPTPPEPSLVARLQTQPRHGLKIVEDASGLVVLSGYCADSAEIDRLRQQLQQAGRLVRDDSVCADVLRRNVRAVLNSNGYEDIDVRDASTPGAVVIHGAIVTDAQWRSTAEQLRGVRGLRNWSVVDDGAESFERLLQMLAKRDLIEGLSLSVDGRSLVVTGALSAQRSRMVEDVIAQYNLGGAGIPARFEKMAAAAATIGLLPARIASVGGNANALFIELENGMRLQRGAVLPNGFSVYALSTSFLELRRGPLLIAVPLNL
ncbi:type III secretion system inner membrane ring subunit SctD [Trinickia sp. EG282A]|uniref:type III secretion system inner membrane ring subunit SctD n=1 Tax=Trinickia sp. EG282A TaxID=3237013 RepID=UPI0034D3255C